MTAAVNPKHSHSTPWVPALLQKAKYPAIPPAVISTAGQPDTAQSNPSVSGCAMFPRLAALSKNPANM